MRSKKTFSGRLTNKYLLIIRNEENFAEKTTFSFNYARLIALGTGIFIVLMVICLYLARTTLAAWFDPQYSQLQNSRRLLRLEQELDSLEQRTIEQNQFIVRLQSIVRGDETDTVTRPDYNDEDVVMLGGDATTPASTTVANTEGTSIDSMFRQEFEESFLRGSDGASSYEGTEVSEIYFFSPISGLVTNGYDPQNEHYGLDIVTASNEPVRCIADGTVIFADYDFSDSGYVITVQHRNNLISIYKHNSALFKKVGNFVSAGDVIAVVGNTGELTNGPHLHFEMWYNGNPINPQAFVSF